MKLKKYNPVKVVDPFTDGHAVRLQSCQAFQLILTKNSNEFYDVELNSEYLIIEKIERVFNNGIEKEIYFISQKYDLSSWAKISNVFLGNVIVSRKQQTESVPVGYQICVYLNCVNESKQKVVTVINPNNHLIKIEPSSLLEIVIFGKDAGRWSLMSIEEIGCYCIRSETVYNDIPDVYDANLTFCPEPRNVSFAINPLLEESKFCVTQQELHKAIDKCSKEYHFWVHLDVKSVRKASTTPNGNYSMGNIKFSCKNEEDVVVKELFSELMLSLRHSNNNVNSSEYQALRSSVENWSIRSINPAQNSVLCPNFNENVDIIKGAEFLYVEIPQPSVYMGKDVEGYWSVDASLENNKKVGLQISELSPRYVNGFMVQRFVVKNSEWWSKLSVTTLFLGHINFSFNKFKRAPLIPYASAYKGICIGLWRSTESVEAKISNLSKDIAKEQNDKSNYKHTYSDYHHYSSSYKQSYSEIEIIQTSLTNLEDDVKDVICLDSIVSKKSVKTELCVGYNFFPKDDDYDDKKKVNSTHYSNTNFCFKEDEEKTGAKEEKNENDWRQNLEDETDYDYTEIFS